MDALGSVVGGQRIKALEEYLGVDLLTRGRSGLSPTATLAPAPPHLRAAFLELEATTEALHLQRGHEIHVAAMSDIAELWLKPRLPRFQAAHPNISFRINGKGEAPGTEGLEGVPLLHVEFYRNDPQVPDWRRWIAENGLSRTSRDRGMRLQRISATADAVLADAGLVLCGLALLQAPSKAAGWFYPSPWRAAAGRHTPSGRAIGPKEMSDLS